MHLLTSSSDALLLPRYVAVGPDPTLTAKGREMAIANGRANKEAIAAVDFFVVSPMFVPSHFVLFAAAAR